MTGETCLVTGGAGFIGCTLSSALAERFERVIALDNLHPQIHKQRRRPDRLDARVGLWGGDVTDEEEWDRVLAEVRPDVVIHLAAETGTGQSLTEGSRHGLVNVVGTTRMLDAFVRHDLVPRKFVLSSSRAVYGEGQWRRADGTLFSPPQRTIAQLEAGQWDHAGAQVLPSEAASTPPKPISTYGATKLAQEHILTAWCASFGSDLSVLRFQNVYGEGQSLTNSYTGIVALFCRLARDGQSIPLYEDGRMLRDFVHVDDVARSVLATIDRRDADPAPLDIGTGVLSTIAEAAEQIASRYQAPKPHVCGKFRFGDVRHAACRVDETERRLGWSPEVSLAEGLGRLSSWVDGELSAQGKL